MRSILALLFLTRLICAAEPEFPLTDDSKPQPDVPKGTLLKDTYTAEEASVFPGTQREYQIYLPAGFDKTKPTAFMVFQDGVIYQAPVVFDNLIAKKDIPPLVGIFIKPGVVPAANDNALPRFNRSYEYDSITPTYSQFLLDEFLPAITKKHGIELSTDPNHAAISGNSSGGICAFMAAWHRPDRFRRVFTGVGTYVGIHGADQLPVLVRKFEPKPLRIFLQSGTGDNNLYCGDWWMANQMMERSLTWAGYDVNHAWGEGGHNAKHATQIFPDVLRWLWRDWQTNIEIKANPKSESKWKGYEVVGDGEWEQIKWPKEVDPPKEVYLYNAVANQTGEVFVLRGLRNSHDGLGLWHDAWKIDLTGQVTLTLSRNPALSALAAGPNGTLCYASNDLRAPAPRFQIKRIKSDGTTDVTLASDTKLTEDMVSLSNGVIFSLSMGKICRWENGEVRDVGPKEPEEGPGIAPHRLVVSPDQTHLYATGYNARFVATYEIRPDGSLSNGQKFYELEPNDVANYNKRDRLFDGTGSEALGLCVDTNGWLYVATSLGIQVCDQAGRVNFIIPTPKQPHDVCFGGKDLSELFIACGDTIYKRPTKAKGVVSGQQEPIKPAPPKL